MAGFKENKKARAAFAARAFLREPPLGSAAATMELFCFLAVAGTIIFLGAVEGGFHRAELFARLEGLVVFLLTLDLFRRVIGGLDGEADAALRLVDLDDAGGNFLADLEHFLDLLDAIVADLRDVHQAVDFVGKLDEGAEAGHFADLAGDEVADLVAALDRFPRIVGEMFQAQRNALVGLVDLEHLGFDVVALLQHFGRMIDLAGPGEIRDMDHAVDALFEFDERAVGGQVADLALDAGAGRVLARDDFPWVGVELADAEGDLLVFLADAEHDGFDFLALGQHVGGTRDPLGPGEFGDVDEAFDARFQFDERAVGDEVGDLALDLHVHRIFLGDLVPRIDGLLLEAEGNAFLFAVD